MRIFNYEVVQDGPSTTIVEHYTNKVGNATTRSIYFTNTVESALLKVRILLQKVALSKAKTLNELLLFIRSSEEAFLKEFRGK